MSSYCKQFTTRVIIAALLLAPFPAAAQTPAASLDALLREARDANPRVKAAYNHWQEAQHRIKVVKSLDDPMVGYMIPGEHVQTRVGPQEKKYGVSQKIPFPGKRGLKGKAQAKKAQELERQYEATLNEILKDVKFVYYDLYWVDRSLEINEEEKSILEKLEKVAQRKFESNMIPQQDVIKVQVELSKIIQKIFMLRQNRDSLNVKLNALLDRAQDAVLPVIVAIDRRDFALELEEVLEMTRQGRQELLAADLSVERAEYEKSLAKMAYLPDLTVGAEYIEVGGGTTTNINDGQDAWMGTVSVNVPMWFGKLRAQVKEKEAALEAARHSKDEMENTVTYEAQDLYFKINAYKDIVLLYETALLPQAQQAFDATHTGFETGSVTFLDWLDTERTYLQTRLAYYRSVTDYHKSIAYLERVIGGDLGDNHEQ